VADLVRMLAIDLTNAVDGALGNAEVTRDEDLDDFDLTVAATVLAGSAIAEVKAQARLEALREAVAAMIPEGGYNDFSRAEATGDRVGQAYYEGMHDAWAAVNELVMASTVEGETSSLDEAVRQAKVAAGLDPDALYSPELFVGHLDPAWSRLFWKRQVDRVFEQADPAGVVRCFCGRPVGDHEHTADNPWRPGGDAA